MNTVNPAPFSNLVDLLRERARVHGEKCLYRFLGRDDAPDDVMSYAELDHSAIVLARHLLRSGAQGKQALLLYAPGLEFIRAFFACLYAGVVAVPVYLPGARAEHWARLAAIAQDAGAEFLLTDETHQAAVATWLASSEMQSAMSSQALQVIVSHAALYSAPFTGNADAVADMSPLLPQVTAQDLAFLQYTSGSTGAPKGVMVTQENLYHNQARIAAAFCHTEHSVVVGWLPQYHDMGLIGNILQPLYIGATAVLMSPTAFLQSPFKWLKAISQYRGTTSGGPNFAYQLCVARITEEQKQQLDLRHWDLAFNGAEPISAATLTQFAAAFKDCGFQASAFFPCYGLAESTLLASAVQKGRMPAPLAIARAALEQDQVALVAKEDACKQPNSVAHFVSCGEMLAQPDVSGSSLVVVSPHSMEICADGQIGEIWLHGPSVTAGYWRQVQLSEQQFAARIVDQPHRYLRTGDLGFVHAGQLYITGRLKDLMIIRGRNFYPQDIEDAVQRRLPQLRLGSGACFSVRDADEEKLVLVHEVERTAIKQAGDVQLWQQIRQCISESFGIQLHALLLLKPGRLEKTSSGKVRRKASKQGFLNDSIEYLARYVADEISLAGENNALAQAPAEAQELASESPVQSLLRAILPARHFAPELALSACGLDSLSAAELAHRLAQQWQIQIDMTQLLDGMTVAQLAGLLAQATERAPTDQETPEPNPMPNPVATAMASAPQLASYNQRSFWQLHAMYSPAAAYNIALPVQIHSSSDQPFQVQLLAQAVDHLLLQHPVLRSHLRETTSDLAVQVHAHIPGLQVVDVSTLAQQEIQALLAAQAAQVFDLTQGPLLRVYLLQASSKLHYLHVVVHHLLVDAWTMQVLLQQLLESYQSLVQGKMLALQPAQRDYADFARAQHAWLSAAAGQSSIQQVRANLRSNTGAALQNLSLAADFPRPKNFAFLGQDVDTQLSPSLTQAIEQHAARLGVTLFTYMQTAFEIFLYRYTQQTEFITGSPVSERDTSIDGDVLGCFVDMKCFAARLAPTLSFSHHVQQAKQRLLQVLQHRRVPSQVALAGMSVQGGWPDAVTPNVRFALQQAQVLPQAAGFLLGLAGTRLPWGDLILETFPAQNQHAAADLSLTVLQNNAPQAGKLHLRFNFNRTIFLPARIEKFAAMYTQLLESIVADDSAPIAQLAMLSSAERQSLLARSSQQQMPFAATACIHHLFEAQAARQPDAIALQFGTQECTYAELNQRANQLAQVLIASGVQIEDRVALYLDRSIEMVVAFLAALKVGACSVMLEPSLPIARCRYIIEDAQVSLLLTNLDQLPDWGLGKIATLDVRTVSLTDLRTEQIANPDLALTANNSAYIIYTSGSTGKPKGVVGLHRGIVNRTQWMLQHFGLQSSDAVLHSTPLGFVRAEREILFPLAGGARLVILASSGINQPDAVLAALAHYQISFTASSPSLLHMLLEQGRNQFAALRSVRHWFIGADALKADLIKAVQQAQPGLQLTYFYGSTEVCSDVAYFSVPAQYQATSNTPIGKPIANNQLYILDHCMEPVADGMPGQLYVGGVQLARGYFGKPHLTEQAFLADPFAKQSAGVDANTAPRLYRSGDLAYRQADGNIVVMGRDDDQVNLYGHRVELGEIEHVIRGLGLLDDVAILLRQQADGHPLLVAFAVSSDAGKINAVRQALKEHLPAYMIPAVFVQMPALPITILGKLDRSALLAYDLGQVEVLDYVAPRNALERQMVEILAQLLGLPLNHLSVQRNLFELGANSAIISQFVARLNQTSIPRALRLTDIYQYHTVHDLANVLAASAQPPKAVATGEQTAKQQAINQRAAARRQATQRKTA